MKTIGFRNALSKRRLVIFVLSILTLLAATASTPLAGQASTGQATTSRKTSTPYNGDLSIFDSPGRDQRLHIDRVMDILGVAPGRSVGDIGAGSGWFTVRAARKVAPAGTVYAVDINPKAIRYIEDRARKENLHDIKTILGSPDDPHLPPDSVDSVLLLKTYHEVAQPVDLLRNLRASLRSGAKLGIIDRNGNGEDHGVGKDIVIREAGEAGFRLTDEQDDLVKDDHMDYFLVFQAK